MEKNFISLKALEFYTYGKSYEGWMKLNDVLINNGLMMIGLYSKRNHIHRIRKDIADLDLKINSENIKNLEQNYEFNNNDYKLITQSTDFYSLSSLRDLIFLYKNITLQSLKYMILKK